MALVRLLLLCVVTLLAPVSEAAARRVALVVANATYQGYAPLNNPVADARLVAQALTQAGFATVLTRTDLGVAALRTELGRFQAQANGAELALIYYAGHGVEVGGRNYLIPTDASLASDAELDFQAIDADLLTKSTAGARARVIVLDACRENPFLGKMRRLTTRPTRSDGRGLAAPLGEGVRGTFLMYSARPGELAQDGPPGANSPFARAFARFLPAPGVELRLAAGMIADAVSDETGNAQLPFTSSSLSGAPIVLVPGAVVVDPRVAELERRAQEAERRFAEAEKERQRLAGLSTPSVAPAPVRPPVAAQQPQAAQSPGGGALWRATSLPATRTILKGHTSVVVTAAFSPDGARIITAGDKTARIWDARSGQSLLTLQGHSNNVLSAAFSNDGARLVTASDDNTARVWDARSGQSLLLLQGHTGHVLSAAFSPDGARIVTGSSDKTARVSDARSGQGLLTLQGHTAHVWSVNFSPDGARIVTGSLDNTARVWDARSGKSLITLQGHTGAVYSAAFSPDGARIITAGDKTARIWDARSGQSLLTLQGHSGTVRSATFSPDGTRIITGSHDDTARIWDARSGQSLLTLQGHMSYVLSAAFSPDGARIVTGSWDGTARVWSPE